MPEPVIVIDLNSKERRLYDRMRGALSGIDLVPGSRFRDVVLLLPDLTVLLARLLRDRRVPLTSKLVALGGVGYVLSPIDVLPALLMGPLGLVDDVLVVAAALSHILNGVHPDIVRSHWSGKGDALAAIQRVTLWSNDLVVGSVRRVLNRARA